MLVKKKLATTAKGARQLIVHKNVLVDGKVVNVPSFVVTKDLEDKISLKEKKVKVKKVEGEGENLNTDDTDDTDSDKVEVVAEETKDEVVPVESEVDEGAEEITKEVSDGEE